MSWTSGTAPSSPDPIENDWPCAASWSKSSRVRGSMPRTHEVLSWWHLAGSAAIAASAASVVPPFVDEDLFQAGGQRLGHLDVGLDLEPAQVTSLVEASGGTIEICNRPPGGTCVSISLPTAPRTKAARD
jgi:hypothetical protein